MHGQERQELSVADGAMYSNGRRHIRACLAKPTAAMLFAYGLGEPGRRLGLGELHRGLSLCGIYDDVSKVRGARKRRTWRSTSSSVGSAVSGIARYRTGRVSFSALCSSTACLSQVFT